MWGVVVMEAGQRQVVTGLLTEAEAADRSQAMLADHPGARTFVVSRKNAFPIDPDKAPVKNRMWCPYCREWRAFKRRSGGYKRCEICDVSDADFYVRQFNRRWF